MTEFQKDIHRLKIVYFKKRESNESIPEYMQKPQLLDVKPAPRETG